MDVRLSTVSKGIGAEVVRDTTFSNLGILSSRQERLLAPFFDPAFADDLVGNDNIEAVITTRDLARQVPDRHGLALSDDPLSSFIDIHVRLSEIEGFYWVDFASEIASDARVHATAYVDARNVRIGPGVRIEPNVTILERSIISDGAVIRAGSVIGTEGFEIVQYRGRPMNVPHTGGVRIGERVEIQANCNVVRNIYGGFTEIGADTKIGGHCQIGHTVRIGRRCEIRPGVLISGSSTIGDDVWIAANATISTNLTIGDGAAVFLGEVVTRDVPPGMAAAKGSIYPKEKLFAVTKTIKQRRRAR